MRMINRLWMGTPLSRKLCKPSASLTESNPCSSGVLVRHDSVGQYTGVPTAAGGERKITKIEFVMPDVNHTFRRGHRIMVQVQSSWFPLVDINPQTFVDIYTAKPSDFQKATERVYRGKNAESHVDVFALPAASAGSGN